MPFSNESSLVVIKKCIRHNHRKEKGTILVNDPDNTLKPVVPQFFHLLLAFHPFSGLAS